MKFSYAAYLDEWKQKVGSYYEQVSLHFDHYEKMNRFFYQCRRDLLRKIIPEGKKVLDLGCGGGDNLAAVNPAFGMGLDISSGMIKRARDHFKDYQFIVGDVDFPRELEAPWDYIMSVNLLLEVPDLFKTLRQIKLLMHSETRFVILNHNSFWEWGFRFYTFFRRGKKRIRENWLNRRDYENLFSNSGLKVVQRKTLLLCPFYIPLLSTFLNRFCIHLPILNRIGMLECFILMAPPQTKERAELSAAVIVPCKNEEENLPDLIQRVPAMGSHTELILVDDQSTDGTHALMDKLQKEHPDRSIKICKGPGTGKGAACRVGFEAAENDVLIILDADMTVPPEVLPDFFNILQEGHAEFVNGSRQVYALEKDSMRLANRLGNGFFAWLFSKLMGFYLNDTLCGTKAFFRENFDEVLESREYYQSHDLWGDFDLLFAASRHHMSFTEHPVHYFPRTGGETKMVNRLKNARIMFANWWRAFHKNHF